VLLMDEMGAAFGRVRSAVVGVRDAEAA